MAGKGDNLEKQIKIFFEEIFEECGYTVKKNRRQKSGTQDGFDNELIIIDEYFREFKIYIECKDYTSKIHYSETIVKIPSLIDSVEPDLFLFVSPKTSFSNPFNDTRLQDFYNHFKTPIEFLTPDNRIEELLSLNDAVYQAIYSKRPAFIIDRQEKLEWFKKFIFSLKPLKKVVLKEEDRSEYIRNLELSENYIERFVKGTERNIRARSLLKNSVLSFQESINGLKCNEANGVVLLGNPGSGKSIELTRLAINEWVNREENGWIPFFAEIRTFTQNCSIEKYLPKGWKNIPQLLIIYDGVDEIMCISSFVLKIEKFITDNQGSRNRIKFVLSCRTNIYENIIKSIPNFDVIFLSDIDYSEALNYLHNIHGISGENLFLWRGKIQEFLNNPYYLKLFGEYYSKHKTLPVNKADLIGKFVENRLEHERLNKYKLHRYDKSLVKKLCERVALSMEAMQLSEISDSQVLGLLGAEKEIFIDSCFIEKVFGRDFWKFEHRNLQEYFVAKSISRLSFDRIIEFISIETENCITHPSWLNSISYLLSILELKSEKYSSLINWLIRNDPEVLFRSDFDRLSIAVRTKLFKNHFIKRCVEDTLWIRSYDSGVIELAKFADSPESIEFLFRQLKNRSNHRRARISAADLLSYMSIQDKAKEVKRLIVNLISAPIDDVDIGFKVDIIYHFKRLNYHHDSNFLENIIEGLGEIDHSRIVSILLLLMEETEPDRYAFYIQNHASKILDDRKRKYSSNNNLVTGEKDHFIRILIKFEEKENLIFALKFYLQNRFSLSLEKEVKNNLMVVIEKLVSIWFKDFSVYNSMINIIEEKIHTSNLGQEYEKIFLNFFVKTNTAHTAFIDVFNMDLNFNKKRRFLVLLSDDKNIKFIAKEFWAGKIDNTEITFFRNSLSYSNFELALKLQELIERKIPKVFADKLKPSNRQNWSRFHIDKYQLGFNLLFDVERLKSKSVDFFKMLKFNEVFTWDDMDDFDKRYWESLKLQLKFPSTFIDIIHDLLRGNPNGISIKNIIKLLEEDSYIFNKIKMKIQSSPVDKITVSPVQKKKIYVWCLENLHSCDFKNFYDLSDSSNNLKCYLLWYFRAFFDFKYPTKDLLNMLLIDGQMKLNQENLGYGYILKAVDKKLVNERIILNLRSENLQGDILINHLNYVLENNLQKAYHYVENYLIDTKQNLFSRKTLLKTYIGEIKSEVFLKRFVTNYKRCSEEDNIYWDCIKLLIEKGEIAFITRILLNFIKECDSRRDSLASLKFLIRANYSKGFGLYTSWMLQEKNFIKSDRWNSLTKEDCATYSNKDAIDDLLRLFELAHQNLQNYDRMYHPIYIPIQTLENIAKMNGVAECEKILKGLNLIHDKVHKNGGELFYLNTLKSDINKIYCTHKSKPFSLKEILLKIDELQYDLI